MKGKEHTVFTYLKLINNGDTSDIVVDDKIYNQFLINRGLSFFIDTIAIVNEINKYGCVSNQMHFDFLRNTVTPRNRYSKWPKPKVHKEAQVISAYLDVTMSKAYDYIGIIPNEQIKQMEKELEVGKNAGKNE